MSSESLKTSSSFSPRTGGHADIKNGAISFVIPTVQALMQFYLV